jgi:DNA modification methylase
MPIVRKTEPSIQEKFRAKQEALARNPALLHTRHRVILGDARLMEEVPDNSIHLVVTSPPYWILKRYDGGAGEAQLGHLKDYAQFHQELQQVALRLSTS